MLTGAGGAAIDSTEPEFRRPAKHFEAFDASDKTLGLFQSEVDAVKMIFSREDLHDESGSAS